MDVLTLESGSARFTRPEHLESYTFDAEKFGKIAKLLHEKIRAYDPEGEYGIKLSDHLERTSFALECFMDHLGYEPETCYKVRNAFYLHDLGKIGQNAGLWMFTEEKPDAGKKSERLKHVDLGKGILKQFLNENNIALTRDDERHIETIIGFMENHHERLDESGPKGLEESDMPQILRMATIVDTYDGKATKPGRDCQICLEEMETGKHKGQFDKKLIRSYRNLIFGQQRLPLLPLPVPSHQ